MSFGLPGIQVGKYGTWTSPIDASRVAASTIRLSAVAIDGADAYWLEGRPAEGGRNVLVRCAADGVITDVTPPGSNVRSRVHEYGGGAYAVAEGTVYYANFKDQRVYRLTRDGSPEPMTPGPDPEATAPNPPPRWFFADFAVDHKRGHLVCVREDYTTGGEPQNTLVRIPLSGEESEGEVIASGHDFYSTPRISPDGEWLSWLAWRHPYMPWEAAELWVARIAADGRLTGERRLAGGTKESVYQPGWSPGGVLHFVSDRDGWWKLYRLDRHEAPESAPVPVTASAPRGAEFGRPQWVFGTATWAFASEDRLVLSYTRRGAWHLATLDVPSGTLSNPIADLAPHEWLAASGTDVLLVSGSSLRPDAVVRLNLDTGVVETLRAASDQQMDPASISVPEAIEFPTGKGRTAHAFFYPPRNRDFIAPPGERPPLVVISHGGPTAATTPTFHLEVQFWTTHGFAVVDVNYGGSSGYGREYRERLNGQWGVVDVEDCVNAVRYLSGQARVDRRRLFIRGGSAGGYTTLAALTFHPHVFAAGASYYGISDIEALVHDSHKFESRCLETLVGPYPGMKDLYRARSPIHYVDRLACPLILFQGLEDKVVPPVQSEAMANAVRAKGFNVVYLAFEGEQHGFRKAETITRCLTEELAFYRSVLSKGGAAGAVAG